MNDKIKRQVALAVQETLLRGIGPFKEPLLSAAGVEADRVECYRVDNVNTRVRVAFTDGSGSRHFLVHISEQPGI
jgi:hypothetical protein